MPANGNIESRHALVHRTPARNARNVRDALEARTVDATTVAGERGEDVGGAATTCITHVRNGIEMTGIEHTALEIVFDIDTFPIAGAAANNSTRLPAKLTSLLRLNAPVLHITLVGE